MATHHNQPSPLRQKVYDIVFEAETPAGRQFDVVLLICVLASVSVVILESVESIRLQYGSLLRTLEWIFTITFTLEYLVRIWAVTNRLRYVKSFYGIIDLMAVLPTYLAVFFPGAHSLMVIRSMRLVRMFRIFKLTRYVGAGENIAKALASSRAKIIVFLVTVLSSVVIMGTVMFLVEGPENGFTDIPTSIYWAIVTMTTVGYGDISPHTPLGQALASMIMIMGYGIIAVPTGIVSAEMINLKRNEYQPTQVCPHCLKEGHDRDARYCKICGQKL